MQKLGEIFPEEFKDQYIIKAIKPGNILYLSSTFINQKPEAKFYIVVSDKKGIWRFKIRSELSSFIRRNEDLTNYQIEINEKDYPCLQYRSYIDCSQIYDQFSKNEIYSQLKNDLKRFKMPIKLDPFSAG
ncbi:MAG: hypothetical protein A2161_05200 [Candidatus Schekmanbacteria bacterium RBG_13_48_7]|uniref:Uncharacterized protein n=1 Tax=Candidatus Schekmanbacteria bacterium RBG_13_48_7 TaxID=1817878 RepID=A0A1F7RM32_9BACT|nr:MAG: hypothetical protein A2161_05200 [Candidatus Schekmanbacteria bacterium RBG_13_48_7]